MFRDEEIWYIRSSLHIALRGLDHRLSTLLVVLCMCGHAMHLNSYSNGGHWNRYFVKALMGVGDATCALGSAHRTFVFHLGMCFAKT